MFLNIQILVSDVLTMLCNYIGTFYFQILKLDFVVGYYKNILESYYGCLGVVILSYLNINKLSSNSQLSAYFMSYFEWFSGIFFIEGSQSIYEVYAVISPSYQIRKQRYEMIKWFALAQFLTTDPKPALIYLLYGMSNRCDSSPGLY